MNQNSSFAYLFEIQDSQSIPFYEHLTGREFSTSTSFLDFPLKRNSQQLHQKSRSEKTISKITRALSPTKLDHPTHSSNPDEIIDLGHIDFKKALLPSMLSSVNQPGIALAAEDINLRSSSASNGKSNGELARNTTISMFPTESQWYQLDQLRIHAGAPERSEDGVERLLQYYNQLLHMEKKFPFDTLRVDISFSWYDSLCSDKKVTTKCIQYEKAAVIYNAAAIYAQLATSQNLRLTDGKKKAAIYFQKSAQFLLFCRDSICQRLQVSVKNKGDLSESTLSTLADTMFAQAVECFYEKANDDKASSTIISMISIQISDHYESALQNSNSISNTKLPKAWSYSLNVKSLLFKAIAHFHSNSVMPQDKMVSERIARLLLASSYATKALEASTPGLLSSICQGHSDIISNSLMLAQSANFEKYHQQEIDTRLLSPLKHSQQNLLASFSFTDIVGDLERFVDIFQSVLSQSHREEILNYYSESDKVIDDGEERIRGCVSNIEAVILANAGVPVPKINIVGVVDQKKVEIHSKSKYLLDQIKSVQQEENVLSSTQMIKSLHELNEVCLLNLDEAVNSLHILQFNTSKSNHEALSLLELYRQKYSDFVNEISNTKITLEAIEKTYGKIRGSGIIEWTEEEFTDILPCATEEYVSHSYYTDSIHHESIKKEKESILIRLDGLRKNLCASLKELAFKKAIKHDANTNFADFNKHLTEKKDQLKVIEESIDNSKKESTSLISRLEEIKKSEKLALKKGKDVEFSRIIESFSASLQEVLQFRDFTHDSIKKGLLLKISIETFKSECAHLNFGNNDNGGINNPHQQTQNKHYQHRTPIPQPPKKVNFTNTFPTESALSILALIKESNLLNNNPQKQQPHNPTHTYPQKSHVINRKPVQPPVHTPSPIYQPTLGEKLGNLMRRASFKDRSSLQPATTESRKSSRYVSCSNGVSVGNQMSEGTRGNGNDSSFESLLGERQRHWGGDGSSVECRLDSFSSGGNNEEVDEDGQQKSITQTIDKRELVSLIELIKFQEERILNLEKERDENRQNNKQHKKGQRSHVVDVVSTSSSEDVLKDTRGPLGKWIAEQTVQKISRSQKDERRKINEREWQQEIAKNAEKRFFVHVTAVDDLQTFGGGEKLKRKDPPKLDLEKLKQNRVVGDSKITEKIGILQEMASKFQRNPEDEMNSVRDVMSKLKMDNDRIVKEMTELQSKK